MRIAQLILTAAAALILSFGTAFAADDYELRIDAELGDFDASVFLGDGLHQGPRLSANDRGGYRVFIPRGRQGPPEYYGDYSRGPVKFTPRYRHRSRGHRDRHNWDRGNTGIVIDGPGYHFEHSRSSRWTAPSNYDYGYYNNSYYGNSYAYPRGSTIVIDGRPIAANPPPPLGIDYGYAEGDVYNDNSYYDNRDYSSTVNGDVYNAPVNSIPPLPGRTNPPAVPAPNAGPELPRATPSSSRFGDASRIVMPESIVSVKIDGSKLWIGPADGEAQLVAEDVDAGFGGFASFTPSSGASVIFKHGGELAVALQSAKGKWSVQSLPYAVDFGQNVNLGLVGGQPWATVTSTDGTRYVMAVTAGGWSEIGSGTREEPKRAPRVKK